jgi:hypothetical protein
MLVGLAGLARISGKQRRMVVLGRRRDDPPGCWLAALADGHPIHRTDGVGELVPGVLALPAGAARLAVGAAAVRFRAGPELGQRLLHVALAARADAAGDPAGQAPAPGSSCGLDRGSGPGARCHGSFWPERLRRRVTSGDSGAGGGTLHLTGRQVPVGRRASEAACRGLAFEAARRAAHQHGVVPAVHPPRRLTARRAGRFGGHIHLRGGPLPTPARAASCALDGAAGGVGQPVLRRRGVVGSPRRGRRGRLHLNLAAPCQRAQCAPDSGHLRAGRICAVHLPRQMPGGVRRTPARARGGRRECSKDRSLDMPRAFAHTVKCIGGRYA